MGGSNIMGCNEVADEKNTIEKLEERLANAATKFKEMKSQIDAKDKEIEELKNKVNDLEGELTLDGGEFNKKYLNIDIHKNNPTLLYYKSL